MSVRTEADDRCESARRHIREAVKDLAAVEIKECYGHDEYTKEHREKIREAFGALLELKRVFCDR